MNVGVLQGSLISLILYLFYNTNLLDRLGMRGLSLGFINGTVYGVQGESDKENTKELRRILITVEK